MAAGPFQQIFYLPSLRWACYHYYWPRSHAWNAFDEFPSMWDEGINRMEIHEPTKNVGVLFVFHYDWIYRDYPMDTHTHAQNMRPKVYFVLMFQHSWLNYNNLNLSKYRAALADLRKGKELFHIVNSAVRFDEKQRKWLRVDGCLSKEKANMEESGSWEEKMAKVCAGLVSLCDTKHMASVAWHFPKKCWWHFDGVTHINLYLDGVNLRRLDGGDNNGGHSVAANGKIPNAFKNCLSKQIQTYFVHFMCCGWNVFCWWEWECVCDVAYAHATRQNGTHTHTHISSVFS